jgi:hypothetical protein
MPLGCPSGLFEIVLGILVRRQCRVPLECLLDALLSVIPVFRHFLGIKELANSNRRRNKSDTRPQWHEHKRPALHRGPSTR